MVVCCCEVGGGAVESVKIGVWSGIVVWVDEIGAISIWTVLVWTWELFWGGKKFETCGD